MLPFLKFGSESWAYVRLLVITLQGLVHNCACRFPYGRITTVYICMYVMKVHIPCQMDTLGQCSNVNPPHPIPLWSLVDLCQGAVNTFVESRDLASVGAGACWEQSLRTPSSIPSGTSIGSLVPNYCQHVQECRGNQAWEGNTHHTPWPVWHSTHQLVVGHIKHVSKQAMLLRVKFC